MLGKTNSPEFGLNATTEDGLFPPTRNPWNTGHSAGGSSGGSGAALAARLVPFAEGSDGGGSIRIPAAFTGTVGLKPQFGRVPAWPASPSGSRAWRRRWTGVVKARAPSLAGPQRLYVLGGAARCVR